MSVSISAYITPSSAEIEATSRTRRPHQVSVTPRKSKKVRIIMKIAVFTMTPDMSAETLDGAAGWA